MEALPRLDGGVMVVGQSWTTWTVQGRRFWRTVDTGVVCTRADDGTVCELRYPALDDEPIWMRVPARLERAS